MATRPTLERAVADGNLTADMFNDNFDDTLDYVSAVDTEKGASITSLQTDVSNLKTPPIVELTGTTPSLQDNKVHSIEISGNTTFTLPTVSDNTKFHQILVLLTMPEDEDEAGKAKYTITLNTTHYFYNTIPNITLSGKYTVIYEHDSTNWVVGAMYKGA